MKSIRIGNDIRIVWPIVLSGDVSKLKDLDLTVEVRPSKKILDTENFADDTLYSKSETTIMMNGGVVCRTDIGDGKEHCKPRPFHTRPNRATEPVKLPYYIENNTLIAMWTADRQFAVGDYDIIVYAHKNGGGQAVADTYRFVRLVPHTAQADGPDNSGIEAVITMQPLTLCLSGLSAYEVAVVNGFQGSVEEWLESLKAGKLSSYVSVESIDNLPKQGDESTGYIIGTKLYIYVGTGGDTLEGKYKDVGEFRGPQGAPGSNGKSAYELAVEGGYEGSVEEWLLSLKGRDGVDGVNGADGLDGENGKDGVTPLIRWNNNRIEQSTDNGKSWWALSDKFNNKLYIKGYVTSADKLPKNALVGDMYGVGPIYGDDDVEQTKPYYQVYVNTVTDWAKSATITKVYQGDTELPQSAENNEIILIKKSTDNYLVYKYVNGSWNLLANLAEIYVEKDDIVNRGDNIFALVQSEIENQYELYERVVSWRNSGTFTSITAGIVNELGDSESAVMSQKAVTDAILNKIDLSAIDFDAQTIAKLAFATVPTRYNVISSNKNVGIMEVFSDNNGHMVTEVFDTHYTLVDGTLGTAHLDDKIFRYMRSYHISGGTSDIPVGTWGEWRQVYSSDNQNDIDTLKTDILSLGSYIENAEFIRAYTDSEDKFLWGIRIDGSIEWVKGVPTPIQNALKELADKIKDLGGDKIEEVQMALNEKIEALQDAIDVINASLKQLTDTFSYQDSPEFVSVVTDNENKMLFGIKEDGKPYFPKNEMYHVESNQEFLAAWLDSAGHVLFGLRTDGSTYVAKADFIEKIEKIQQLLKDNGIGDDELKQRVEALENNFTNLQDTFNNTFSIISNDEWLHAVVDAEGKLLFGIRAENGEVVMPKQDTYKVIRNDEWLAAWLDSQDRILFGVKADGTFWAAKSNFAGGGNYDEQIAQLNKEIQQVKDQLKDIDTSGVANTVFSVFDDEEERIQTFVVHTFSVDRAMMLITHWIKNKEDEYEKQAKEKGYEYEKREIHTSIESAKPIPVGRFIPREFSMAYVD